MLCKICSSPHRAEIENAILSMVADAPPSDVRSIESIAKHFEVPLEELKMHALFHTPLLVKLTLLL